MRLVFLCSPWPISFSWRTENQSNLLRRSTTDLESAACCPCQVSAHCFLGQPCSIKLPFITLHMHFYLHVHTKANISNVSGLGSPLLGAPTWYKPLTQQSITLLVHQAHAPNTPFQSCVIVGIYCVSVWEKETGMFKEVEANSSLYNWTGSG